jgi:surface protein
LNIFVILKYKEYQLSEEKMKEYFKIHINNKRIKSNLQYNFPRKGEYKIKIEIKKLLNNMSDMFSDCSSLTSLNLSNFNTNNVEDMNHMFYHIPESCKIIHDDKKKI